MHIMEGFLPLGHAVAWTLAAAPFWVIGVVSVVRQVRHSPESKLLLSAAGGFAFVLSALKIPSVTGSCSHPTGVGLGAALFGPGVMLCMGSVVLVFQALFLAHGGLTTLGANAFSMAVVGSLVAWSLVSLGHTLRLPMGLSVFIAAFASDMATYLTTATQLAIAFPDIHSGFWGAWLKFASIFGFTQVPLALSEALLTVLVLNLLRSQVPREILGRIPLFRNSLSKEVIQ